MAELTPAIINKQPRGFLSFFDMKGGAKAPQLISTTLLPIVEMKEWYRNTNELVGLNGPVNGAVGDIDFFGLGSVVPPGEFWFINNMAVSCVCPAGTTVRFAPTLQKRAGGGARIVFPVGDFAIHSGAATVEAMKAYSIPGGFYAPPDSTFGVAVQQLVGAGPVPFFLQLAYVPNVA